MENEYVNTATCDALHEASNIRIARIERDTEKQWDTIDDLRKALQKQAIQVAMIVGGVSAVVQIISIAVQLGFKLP